MTSQVVTNMHEQIDHDQMSNVRISLGYRTMMSKTHTLQICQFEVEEKRRKVEDLQAMIDDFRQMVVNLDHQILSEQQKSGITDVNHYAYPTFAKAAIQRRDNLIVSVEDLEAKLEQARLEMEEAGSELTKAQQLHQRDNGGSKLRNDPHQTSNAFNS